MRELKVNHQDWSPIKVGEGGREGGHIKFALLVIGHPVLFLCREIYLGLRNSIEKWLTKWLRTIPVTKEDRPILVDLVLTIKF